MECGVGRFMNEKPADERIVGVCSDIKPKVEAHLNSTYTVFEPVSYQVMIADGTYYLVKVKVGQDEQITIKIHKNFKSELILLEAGPTQ